ncbi:hypothetical protein Tco_1407467 [Tanacetum coccineum]
MRFPPSDDVTCHSVDIIDLSILDHVQEILSSEPFDSFLFEPIDHHLPTKINSLWDDNEGEQDRINRILENLEHESEGYTKPTLLWRTCLRERNLPPNLKTYPPIWNMLSLIRVLWHERLNLKVQDVVKAEIVKLLDAGLIYAISDSPWGLENLAADHLSRLENPKLEELDEDAIHDSFPDEQLMVINIKEAETDPWYADYAKFLVSKIVPQHLTYHLRKKFLFDVKKYIWDDPYLFKTCPDGIARTAYKAPIGSTLFRIVYGKACHLPLEMEHKAYWALKKINLDLDAAGKHRFLRLNQLDELRTKAYEHSRAYKERTKWWHDSKIMDKEFQEGEEVKCKMQGNFTWDRYLQMSQPANDEFSQHLSDDEASNHEDASDTGAALHNNKVIQNGNSNKRISTGKDGGFEYIPQKHMRRFHGMDDAKEIWEAIKTRFGGNANSKKMQKALEDHGAEVSTEDANHKFLRSLPPAWSNLAMTMRTKPDVDTLSIDDMYNNLRVFEQEIQGASKTFSSAQNVAFVSQSKSSTNKVKSGFTGAYSTCTPSTSSTNTPEKEALAGFADEIDDLDIEEMRHNGSVAMIAIRLKGFIRKQEGDVRVMEKALWECTAKGTHDGKKKRDSFYQHQEAGKQKKNQMGLLTMDDGIVNWGKHTEDEETNHALMAISSSSECKIGLEKDSVGKPLYSRFTKTNDFKGVPHLLSGDYTPKPQEEIDESPFAGSIRTSSVHSVDLESKISRVPQEVYVSKHTTTNEKGVSTPKSKEGKYSSTKKKCFVCGSLCHLIKDCDYYEKKMAREAGFEKQRVFNTGNMVAKPVWTNDDRINHDNQFVPRLVQLNAGRPNINSVRPNINTGRTNINSVRPNVNTVRSRQPCTTRPQTTLFLKDHRNSMDLQLRKPDESAGFAEIVDFLRGSNLRYALTTNPTIYDSLVKQFGRCYMPKLLADGLLELKQLLDTIVGQEALSITQPQPSSRVVPPTPPITQPIPSEATTILPLSQPAPLIPIAETTTASPSPTPSPAHKPIEHTFEQPSSDQRPPTPRQEATTS